MIDRLFTLALLVCVLAGGTAAVGSEWFSDRAAQAQTQVVQLPRVIVTGKKQAASTDVATAEAPATGALATSKFVQ